MMKHFFTACLLVLAAVAAHAQVADSSALFKTLAKNDSLVFEEGFNKCRLDVYNNILADDLEFYHDKGGITKGKAAFIASARNNICGSKTKIRRELVSGSLQVYPLYNNKLLYGAIQQGVHQFYFFEDGRWKLGGTAKFTHLWLLEKSQWQLKRVLSYDHR